MNDARVIIDNIKNTIDQVSSSRKDEVTVMRAMLNDPNFTVGIYNKNGKVGDYCPSKSFRKMISGIISSTVKISQSEANTLIDNYEFTKSDATTMVELSKEFINTYVQTGRKLPLGGREKFNVSLEMKKINERVASVPSKSGNRINSHIPEHYGIKATNPCPQWVK